MTREQLQDYSDDSVENLSKRARDLETNSKEVDMQKTMSTDQLKEMINKEDTEENLQDGNLDKKPEEQKSANDQELSEEIIEKFFDEKEKEKEQEQNQASGEDFLDDDSDERDDDQDDFDDNHIEQRDDNMFGSGTEEDSPEKSEPESNQGNKMGLTLKSNAEIFGLENGQKEEPGKYSGFNDLEEDGN